MNSMNFSLIFFSFAFWNTFGSFWNVDLFALYYLFQSFSTFAPKVQIQLLSCATIAFLFSHHQQTIFRFFLQNENISIVSSRRIHFPHMKPFVKVGASHLKFVVSRLFHHLFRHHRLVKRLQNIIREAFGSHRCILLQWKSLTGFWFCYIPASRQKNSFCSLRFVFKATTFVHSILSSRNDSAI